MLKIDPQSWFVQLFYFSEKLWKMFTNSWYETNSSNTNLCTFIRTIFILAPLAFATNVAAWGWMIYVFLYYPFATFGVVPVSISLGAVVGIGVTAFTLVWCLSKLQYFRRQYLTNHPRLVPKFEPKEPKKPGFIDLIWQYLVDAHNNVCVMIKIEPEAKKETVS